MLADEIVQGVVYRGFDTEIADDCMIHPLPDRIDVVGPGTDDRRAEIVAQHCDDAGLRFRAHPLEARIGLHFAQPCQAVIGVQAHQYMIEPAKSAAAFDQRLLHR